jgi:hypothetical protein
VNGLVLGRKFLPKMATLQLFSSLNICLGSSRGLRFDRVKSTPQRRSATCVSLCETQAPTQTIPETHGMLMH